MITIWLNDYAGVVTLIFSSTVELCFFCLSEPGSRHCYKRFPSTVRTEEQEEKRRSILASANSAHSGRHTVRWNFIFIASQVELCFESLAFLFHLPKNDILKGYSGMSYSLLRLNFLFSRFQFSNGSQWWSKRKFKFNWESGKFSAIILGQGFYINISNVVDSFGLLSAGREREDGLRYKSEIASGFLIIS